MQKVDVHRGMIFSLEGVEGLKLCFAGCMEFVMSYRWILGDKHPHSTVKQQQGNHHVSGHGEGDTRALQTYSK